MNPSIVLSLYSVVIILPLLRHHPSLPNAMAIYIITPYYCIIYTPYMNNMHREKCFGESGVLSSGKCASSSDKKTEAFHSVRNNKRRIELEAYHSVAVSNVHLLLLRPEHYDQLSTKVVDRLVAQVKCRREWEEARGQHMMYRQAKDSEGEYARSLTTSCPESDPRNRSGRRKPVLNVASPEEKGGGMTSTTTTTYFVFNMRPATRGTTHVFK
jgi:hypothetical protein